jgi:hypothetical protein
MKKSFILHSHKFTLQNDMINWILVLLSITKLSGSKMEPKPLIKFEIFSIQIGGSRVRFPVESLGFFIVLILPTSLWPWGGFSLYEKRVPGIFPRQVMVAGA